jgi:hypothetical protein
MGAFRWIWHFLIVAPLKAMVRKVTRGGRDDSDSR